MSGKHLQEEKILQLLAAGSERAFTQLFDRYRNQVYGTAFRFLKSEALAEEIVQDVFLKVWLKRDEIAQVDRFDAYLFVMTRNMVFDRIKKMANEAVIYKVIGRSFSEIDHHTENRLQDRQYQQLLQQAVNLLPPRQKQVFQLSRFEGLSQEAIAEKMQLSRLTVKTHMAKALQSIRHYLKHHINSWSPIVVLLKMLLLAQK